MKRSDARKRTTDHAACIPGTCRAGDQWAAVGCESAYDARHFSTEYDDAAAVIARVEALLERAEHTERASLSRTFDGGSFGAWISARDLRAALEPTRTEADQ